MKCEDCGAENARPFHGRETIDKYDRWFACFDCRWPYIRKRVYGEGATGPPGNVVVPEEKKTGQLSFDDY